MPSTNNPYYPVLADVVSTEDLPDILGFLKDGIQELFSNVFYKNLQFSKNVNGDITFYSLDIVSAKKLAIELPGTGIFLVLNPDHQDYNISSFPIAVSWDWKILRHKRFFNINNFSFSVGDYFYLLVDILEVSESDVIDFTLRRFVTPSNPATSRIEQLVEDLNTFYNTSIAVPTDPETEIEEIVSEIHQQANVTAYQAIFSIYIAIGPLQEQEDRLNVFFSAFVLEDIPSFIKEIIFPKIRATLELSAGLEFPRNMLKPVYDANGNNPYDPTSTGVPYDVIPEDGTTGYPKIVLRFGEALFYADTEQGLGYNMDIVLNTNVPAQIGNTGLIIDIQNLKIDLSSTQNFIEADMQGLSPEFMGVYTDYTAITLPKKWFNNVDNTTLQIVGRNLLVGTGGVTGTVALETVGGQPNNGAAYMDLKIGDWKIGFNHFDITFKQNVITQSNIAGRLKIPKLKDSQDNDAEIFITGHLNEVGDFNLTASEPEGIPLTLFNFVTFNFLTLELGRENDKFYIGTSCQIWFQNQVMSKLIGDQIIEIPKLRVYDNGTIEIVGGNGFLPLNISLNLGPVEMAVTGVHYGATQLQYNNEMRKYNYWGFDGAISIDPLGIDIRGDGIKYYYTTDNDETDENGNLLYTEGDSFIHIKTLEIDLVIPGSASPESAVAIINGMLSLPDPGESPEYVGRISLKLPKVKIAGGVAMKLQPRYPAFIIDAFIDLPAPIPIGPLGIYGFRGILGYRYVATKEAVGLTSDDRWYDYYVHDPRGIDVRKFVGPPESLDYTTPVALGVGAVLGTSFDSGTIISARVMLVLSLPTLFMIDGRASILSARLGLDSTKEPPFFAFVAWGDSSIEMGMGADYQLPANGQILDLYAEIQAGFFFNAPAAWYVNFGTKQDPIRITLFKDIITLNAQGYLMLSGQGIEAGARVHFELRARFSPAKVHLYAYIEVGGFISFERPQMGGYIAAGGGIDVDIWIIGISLSLDTLFSAEAAKPFLIYAEVRFRACIKIVFAKVCKSFTVKLKWEKSKTVDRSPVSPLPSSGAVIRVNELVKGIHMLTNDTFDLKYFATPPSVNQIDKVIPLDTFIEIKSEKGLIPGAISEKIGGYTFAPENYVDMIPPQKVVRGGREIRQVKHKYSIENIEIKAWSGNSWQNYHPYEAVVKPASRPDVSHLKWGYWQIKEKQYDTIRLLATTPFTYMEAGEPGWHIPEVFGITPSVLYCEETLEKEDCSNVLNKDLGTRYYPPLQYIGHFINGAYFTLLGYSQFTLEDEEVDSYMEVSNITNVHGFALSLSFSNDNALVIILPEASVKVTLRFTTYSQGATISYYKSVIDDATSLVQYELVHQEYKTASQINNNVIEYTAEHTTISKVIIHPDGSDLAAIQEILEQIEALFTNAYEEADGDVDIMDYIDKKRYQSLLEELEKLKERGCTKVNTDCEKDELLCELYEELLILFERCFIYPVNKDQIETLKKNIKCFEEFKQLIIEFDKRHPHYQLIVLLGQSFVGFVEYLERLKELLDVYPEVSSEEIIEYYYIFRQYALDILNYIKEIGRCDCEDDSELKCTTSLQQICWLSLEKHEWNETIPGSEAIEGEFQDMIDGQQKIIQPIWRPNTAYYVSIQLKDEVDNGESNPGVYNYYYGFKTVGPIGHYHKNPASGYLPEDANADEYPLTSLRSYIDYNRSYPNADGNILKSKPIFYGNQQCKISVFFNKPSTYHMFQTWEPYLNNLPELEGQLHIAIKDPVTDVIIPYPLPSDYDEETVPVPNDDGYTWDGDDNPLLPAHIQVINNMIENGELPCEIDLGSPIVPASSYFTVTLANLRPQKLYTALLYNAFEVTNNSIENEPVHEFVFQTSRYENFEEQVKSYLIKDAETQVETQAVFTIELSLDNIAVTKALDIISNPENQVIDPLGNTYQHLFDRVLQGVFEITPTDPPVRTEFHKILNLNSGDVIAILIKSPEPFNIPKIPLEEVQGMIAVLLGSGNENTSYKVLYNNDYSQAIIMHSSAKIVESTLNFRFKYYTWNGSQYEETDSVLAEHIGINV